MIMSSPFTDIFVGLVIMLFAGIFIWFLCVMEPERRERQQEAFKEECLKRGGSLLQMQGNKFGCLAK
jgi:hypothetical protein